MTRADTRSPERRLADEEIAYSYEQWIVRDPVTGWTDHVATDRLRLLDGAAIEIVLPHPEAELPCGVKGTIIGISQRDPAAFRIELDDPSHRVVELTASEIRLVSRLSVT